MNKKIKDAEAVLEKSRKRLAAAKAGADDVISAEAAAKEAEALLAKVKSEAAAQPPKAERHPLLWAVLAIALVGAFIAMAIALRPVPAPISVVAPPVVEEPPSVEVPVETPPVVEEPPVKEVEAPPLVETPPVAPPTIRVVVNTPPPTVVVTPPPATPTAPAVPVVPVAPVPAPVTPPAPAPVIPAPAPATPLVVNLFSIREEVRAGETWLLVGLRFSGDTQSVREWTIRAGSDQLPWGPFVPGSYEVRIPRPAGTTTFRPLARLASGQEIIGEQVTWTPSH